MQQIRPEALFSTAAFSRRCQVFLTNLSILLPVLGLSLALALPASASIAGPLCGNGRIDAGESCDDGNQDNTDSCLNECQPARCGDGHTRHGGEQCDDGNAVEDDGCTTRCKRTKDGGADAGRDHGPQQIDHPSGHSADRPSVHQFGRPVRQVRSHV